MSETKFTPGPWKLCRHLQSAEKDAACPCGYRGGIWGADGEHIVCEMGSTATPGQEGLEPPRYERPTELANAALIAAAPDLYAALDDMVKLAIQLGAIDLETHDAFAALAKARGETP